MERGYLVSDIARRKDFVEPLHLPYVIQFLEEIITNPETSSLFSAKINLGEDYENSRTILEGFYLRNEIKTLEHKLRFLVNQFNFNGIILYVNPFLKLV